MIISASRRTDIPAYYSEWFFNRLSQGYALVRNPFNNRQISRVDMTPENIEGIVFWSKNPVPMLDKLYKLDGLAYYFQFTLNPYLKDIEPHLPEKGSLLGAFKELSLSAGRAGVVWRYDPIILNAHYNPEFHYKAFKELTLRLAPYTEKCTISFLDDYVKIRSRLQKAGIYFPSTALKEEMVCNFAELARQAGIYIDTCAEEGDFEKYGAERAACIDIKRLERLGASGLKPKRDKGQRSLCGCFKSVDIGAYNTCRGGCIYCYAGTLKDINALPDFNGDMMGEQKR